MSDWGLPPATVWLIDKFIPMGALIAAYALPKKLKTYVALSWACCIAVGLPWPRRQDGIPVKKGKVMYIALESYAGGVKRRVAAGCKAHGVSKKDFLRNFAFLPVPINFSDDGSIRDALAELIFSQHFRPDFIVIDTWFKSVGGADVSDQAEMASAIERLGWFKEALEAATEFKDALPGVTIVIVAHTPKDGMGLFGSIVQTAAIDLAYKFNRVGEAREVTMECTDARDIEAPNDVKILLDEHIIETEAGFEKNLAVTRIESAADILGKPVADIGRTERLIKSILTRLGPSRWTDALEAYQDEKEGKTGDSRTTFKRGLKNLAAQGEVVKEGGLWRVVEVQSKGQDQGQGPTLKGVGPNGPKTPQGHGPQMDPNGPTAPTESCDNSTSTDQPITDLDH